MKPKLETLLNLTVALLLVLVVWLMLALSQSWKNERFLDATINKHTTTNSMTK